MTNRCVDREGAIDERRRLTVAFLPLTVSGLRAEPGTWAQEAHLAWLRSPAEAVEFSDTALNEDAGATDAELRQLEINHRLVALFFENGASSADADATHPALLVFDAKLGDPIEWLWAIDDRLGRIVAEGSGRSIISLVAAGLRPDHWDRALGELATKYGAVPIGDLRDYTSFQEMRDQFRVGGEEEGASRWTTLVTSSWVMLPTIMRDQSASGPEPEGESSGFVPPSMALAGVLTRLDQDARAIPRTVDGLLDLGIVRGVEGARFLPRVSQLAQLTMSMPVVAIAADEQGISHFVAEPALLRRCAPDASWLSGVLSEEFTTSRASYSRDVSVQDDVRGREPRLLDALSLATGSGERRIEIWHGDLTAFRPEDAPDVLVVSAFPGDYLPLPGTLIGALEAKGLSIAALRQRDIVDLRHAFSCWMSCDLQGADAKLGFQRILCFEPLLRGRPVEVIGDIFRALAPFAADERASCRSVAMPLVACGSQRGTTEEIVPALLDSAERWMSSGLPIDRLAIVAYKEGDVEPLLRHMEALRRRQPAALVSPQVTTWDLFVSYAHRDADLVEPLVNALHDMRPTMRIFCDRHVLSPGSAWQQEIYEAIDAARRVVAVLSPEYLQSRVCKEEFNIALCRHRESAEPVLFPLYVRSTALPTYMRLVQYADCREGRIDELTRACTRVLPARP